VDRLIELSSHLPPKALPLSGVRELDDEWFGDEADRAYPIILSAGGAIMDGMHRVAKAALLGRVTIQAVQFDEDPEPDHVGLGPNELTY